MSAEAIEALNAERRLVLDLIGSLTDDEWELASDCDGWRVHDVIAHMGATYVTISGGTTARAEPASDDAERNADAAVDERRTWASDQVASEYESASTAAIAAMAGMQEPPMRDMVIPLGNLGSHPMHILANAIVFDHYCHLRHDLLQPGGPLDRPTLPSDDLRLRPTMEWMLGGLPQMCADALTVVDRPVALVFDGPGGGTWTISPGAPFVTIDEGAAADAATTVHSTAHAFVSWGTKRRDWRDMGVRIEGDAEYGARVLDAVNVI